MIKRGNFYRAKETMAEIPEKNSLQVCNTCFTCRARCANQIDISQRIKELETIWTEMLAKISLQSGVKKGGQFHKVSF